jgi:2-dehydropantoate 2-reductase
MTDTEWARIRPLLPVPAWLEGRGGKPEGDDVMAWKYAKLLANLGNAVAAVFGSAAEGPADELADRALAEGAAVLDAAGIAYVGAPEQARVRGDRMRIQPLNGAERGGGSSWQSLVRGTGSIESDYLNGEIVLLARRLGMPAPVNEALQGAANRLARERRRPGELTAGERAALLAV